MTGFRVSYYGFDPATGRPAWVTLIVTPDAEQAADAADACPWPTRLQEVTIYPDGGWAARVGR